MTETPPQASWKMDFHTSLGKTACPSTVLNYDWLLRSGSGWAGVGWVGLVSFCCSYPVIGVGGSLSPPDPLGLLSSCSTITLVLLKESPMCQTSERPYLSIFVPPLFRWDLQVNQKLNVELHILLNICERLSLVYPTARPCPPLFKCYTTRLDLTHHSSSQ